MKNATSILLVAFFRNIDFKMTTEIFAQLEAIENSISEESLINASQLMKIHELINDASFMYLPPTSIKEIGNDVIKQLHKLDNSKNYPKILSSILRLRVLGYL